MSTSKDIQIRTVLSSVVQHGNRDNCFSYIVNHLSEDEKSRFGDTLLRKVLQTDETTDRSIEDDTVQQLLGYVQKPHFVRFFKRHLDTSEYTEKRPSQSGGQSSDISPELRGGHNLHKYMFDLDTVRKLSMLATTDAGKKARQYYLKLEDLILAYGLEEMQRMQKRVEQLEAKHRPARLQHRERGEYVYVFKDSQATKVGKTSNMNQRYRSYRTMNPDGTINHKIPCLSANLIEKSSHHILDQYHRERNTEWFRCSDDIALEAVHTSQALLDGLAGHAEGIADFKLASRVRDLLKEYHDFLQQNAEKYGELGHDTEHTSMARTATAPAVLPLSKTLFGSGATVFTPEEVPAEDKPVSFRELQAATNDPLDHDKFIHDCFIIDKNAQVMNGQVASVYKFWCNSSRKSHRDPMLSEMKERFNEGKSVYDAVLRGNSRVFFGLKLKRIVYESSAGDEFDQFIAETFIVDCTARVMMTRLQDVYKRWKIARGEGKMTNTWKDDLHAYMTRNFMYDAQVWFGKEERRQQMGYYGVGLPNELIGVGLHPNTRQKGGERVILRHIDDGDIMRVFPTQGAAAQFLDRSESSISGRLKDGRDIKKYTIHRWDSLSEEEKAMVKTANDHVTNNG